MILIISGNGKGKTTSAIGQALRAAGQQKRVAIVFFDKGGDFYGEQAILKKIPKIDVFRFGCERFDKKNQKFRFKNTAEDILAAEKAAKKVMNLYKQDYFLIICDEILNCLRLGLLNKIIVQQITATCPKTTHLYLTGRSIPAWLAKKADLISEISEVKHYFKKGVQALKGLDY